MTIARKVIFSGQGEYGNYQVIDMMYEGRAARMLYGEDDSPQSGMALDDNPGLLFDYNQRFLEMIESVRPKRLLVIGGGVFMLPVAVHQRFGDVAIDVVEIDSLLVDLAQRFFDLPQSDRLKVFVQDGKDFLLASDQLYDMIIVDAFYGFVIPHQLIQGSVIQLYKSHLNPGGAVAVNFISRLIGRGRWLSQGIVDSFSESFDHYDIYPADPECSQRQEQNLLYVGSDQPISYDYLQSASVASLIERTR